MPTVQGRRRRYKRLGEGLGALTGAAAGIAAPLAIGAYSGDHVWDNLSSAVDYWNLDPNTADSADLAEIRDSHKGLSPLPAVAGSAVGVPAAGIIGLGGSVLGGHVGRMVGREAASLHSGLIPRHRRAIEQIRALPRAKAIDFFEAARHAGTPDHVLQQMHHELRQKTARRLSRAEEYEQAGIGPARAIHFGEHGKRIGHGLGALATGALPLLGVPLLATVGGHVGDLVGTIATGGQDPSTQLTAKALGAAGGGLGGLFFMRPDLVTARAASGATKTLGAGALGEGVGKTLESMNPEHRRVVEKVMTLPPDHAHAYVQALSRARKVSPETLQKAHHALSLRRVSGQQELRDQQKAGSVFGAVERDLEGPKTRGFDPLNHPETSPHGAPGKTLRRLGLLGGALGLGYAGADAASDMLDVDTSNGRVDPAEADAKVKEFADTMERAGRPVTPEHLGDYRRTLISGDQFHFLNPDTLPTFQRLVAPAGAVAGGLAGLPLGYGLGRLGDEALAGHPGKVLGQRLERTKLPISDRFVPHAVREGRDDARRAREESSRDVAHARESLARYPISA